MQYTLPAHWKYYLMDNDNSCLSSDEMDTIDRWKKDNNLEDKFAITCSDKESVDANHAAIGYPYIGICNCLEFTF